MSIIKGTNQVVAGFGGTKRSIGEVYFSQSSLATDNSGALPLFTGETITSANTIYPDFYNWVKEHTELCTTKADYDARLEQYGECPFYVADEAAGSLRLPKLTRYVKNANETDGITQAQEGLPNITAKMMGTTYGGLADAYVNASGACRTEGSGGASAKGGEEIFLWKHDFDASRSSAVYGRSDAVTPAHTTLYPWVVAYAAAIPASTAQAAEFQQGLSGKADTNLGNVPANIDYVVESYDDGAGNGWYEYKSGRLVQYGFTTHSSGTGARAYITFYRPMANTSYNYCVMPRGVSGGAAFSFGAGDFSVSGFSFSWDGGSVDPEMVCWRVEGLKGA